MTRSLERQVCDFILWLTPCGEVNPGPSLDVIGWEARKLNRKIIRRGGVADYCGGCENPRCRSVVCCALRVARRAVGARR